MDLRLKKQHMKLNVSRSEIGPSLSEDTLGGFRFQDVLFTVQLQGVKLSVIQF